MTLARWLRSASALRPTAPIRNRLPARLSVEPLEDRTVPSFLTPVAIGRPDGTTNYTPTAINDNGQVIGNSLNQFVSQGYLYSGGTFQHYPLSTYYNWTTNYLDLNNSAVAVGLSHVIHSTFALRYDNQPPPGSDPGSPVLGHIMSSNYVYGNPAATAYAVNDAGVTVGVTTGYVWDSENNTTVGDFQIRATLWENRDHTPVELNIPGLSYALGINSAGTIVGFYDPPGPDGTRAYLYSPDGSGDYSDVLPINLPTPAGTVASRATGINDEGDIIGTIDGQGAVWRLDPDTGEYSAQLLSFGPDDISDSGVVVGGRWAWSEESGTVDVNTLLDPESNWSISNITGINAFNVITGVGSDGSDSTAFTLELELPAATADYEAKGLNWNTTVGGLDYRYKVLDRVADSVAVSFYWSPTDTFTTQAATLIPNTSGVVIPGGTAPDEYTGNLGGSLLKNAPAGTKFILMVLGNPAAPTFDSAKHVKPIADVDVTYGGDNPPARQFFPNGQPLLNDHTLGMIKDALRYAGQATAVITSTYRTYEEQAGEMLDLIRKHGLKHVEGLYTGNAGRQVLSVYRIAMNRYDQLHAQWEKANSRWLRRPGLQSRFPPPAEPQAPTYQALQALMADRIKSIMKANPNGGFAHCRDFSRWNTVDIAPSSFGVSNKPLFLQALEDLRDQKKIVNLIPPPKDDAFHIEVKLKK